jgi:hypothetical protein
MPSPNAFKSAGESHQPEFFLLPKFSSAITNWLMVSFLDLRKVIDS